MSRQYPLPLPHRETMEAEDLMATSSNRDAIAWIDRWPDWPAPCLIIYGPAGAGKTHLAHVWAVRSGGSLLAAEEIAAADIGVLVKGKQVIAIDNADELSGSAAKEENLLHLYNMMRESRGHILLTAQLPPAQWNIGLADLRSRLLAAPAIALAAPDDDLLSALIIKQFRDRQLDIGVEVLDFLLPRLTRTPQAIRDLVAALDRMSLAENRRITISMAKKVLEERDRQ